jgi:hypothetical protein
MLVDLYVGVDEHLLGTEGLGDGFGSEQHNSTGMQETFLVDSVQTNLLTAVRGLLSFPTETSPDEIIVRCCKCPKKTRIRN